MLFSAHKEIFQQLLFQPNGSSPLRHSKVNNKCVFNICHSQPFFFFIINLLEQPCNSLANREVAALSRSDELEFLIKSKDTENVMFCFVLSSYFTLVHMNGLSSWSGGPVMQTIHVK